jgi:uncharacterized membrane protein
MFLLTASAHFTQPRSDGLIAIVPRWIPQPALVITATGILELLGAAGLILPPTRVAAALCLGAMPVAMFPANVRAARGVSHPASPSTPLVARIPIQALFLGVLSAKPGRCGQQPGVRRVHLGRVWKRTVGSCRLSRKFLGRLCSVRACLPALWDS